MKTFKRVVVPPTEVTQDSSGPQRAREERVRQWETGCRK